MNINQLNVIHNSQTTFNEIKRLKLSIYVDTFKTQTESFCKRHCKVTALIFFFFDRGVMQTFYFSDKVPG